MSSIATVTRIANMSMATGTLVQTEAGMFFFEGMTLTATGNGPAKVTPVAIAPQMMNTPVATVEPKPVARRKGRRFFGGKTAEDRSAPISDAIGFGTFRTRKGTVAIGIIKLFKVKGVEKAQVGFVNDDNTMLLSIFSVPVDDERMTITGI